METMTANEAQAAVGSGAALLFVDDEANILSALKRLFRPLGYRIFTAESGALGLEVMQREQIDLVISDMRMPQMTGAQFLEQVKKKWPDAVRILLTGYADITSTIDAINKGQIYRYISKPWEDNDIVLTVRHALERKHLEEEKQRLEDLTLRQNEELARLNAGLEGQVRARTEEVRQTMAFLEMAHENLKQSFTTSIKVFASLIEMREGSLAGHSRRVAETAKGIAQKAGLRPGEIQDIAYAALLRDIGKIGLPDHLFTRPFTSLTGEERAEVMKHPAKGQAALMALEQLHAAAALIRSHHERFDGMGFPDGLSGLQIPLGARILAVADDYDALQIGLFTNKRFSPAEARAFIADGRGKRYDPQVVDAFIAAAGAPQETAAPEMIEAALSSAHLKAGMALARDLMASDGILLLSRDSVLQDAVIAQIRSYEKSEGKPLTVHVWQKRG